MFERENENDNSDQENNDFIFKWIDDIESQPIKKKVSFSNANIIHLIENRQDISWAAFNMYMSDLHYNLIRNEFNREYNIFTKYNPNHNIKSRDEMVIKIYEFIQKQTSKDSLEEFTLSKE
jgi:hypothetical protein